MGEGVRKNMEFDRNKYYNANKEVGYGKENNAKVSKTTRQRLT